MDWEKHLKDLGEYGITFEIKQGYYHISLKYNKDWEVILPDNECIYLEERNGVCHYIASVDSVSIDDIFKTIDNTICYNKDLQKKLELFKKKTEELQEIFAKESLDVLGTIEFKYGKKQTKKRSKSAKRKENQKAIEEVSVDNVEQKEIDGSKEEQMTDDSQSKEQNNGYYIEDSEVVPMGGEYMEELDRKD